MTSEEVAKLTEKSNDYWLNEKLGVETWTSSEEIPEKQELFLLHLIQD